MKSKLAIYLSVLAMVFAFSSCANDGGDEAFSPYAYIKSFSIGDVKSSYPAFTATGKDTVIVKTISGSSYPFVINQASGEIYNSDSLPYATNLSKLVIGMTLEGVAMIYVEESGAYESFSLEDSLDFTTPRDFRVTSLDGSYSKFYTISVNAHQVEPDLLTWKNVSAGVSPSPEKAMEFGDRIYVFGRLSTGDPVVVSTKYGENVVWSMSKTLGSLPSTVDFSTMHLFNGTLYVLADGDLYTSADAENWTVALQGYGLLAIIGASEAEDCLWFASADNIYRREGAGELSVFSALPDDFPLYGVSTMSYALSHNKSIMRYVLVGYTTKEKDGSPKVWSMLSTEDAWEKYDNTGNQYSCPALERLAVLRYDDELYAFGGKGTAEGKEVEAFSSFYVSRDNGITWKAQTDFYQTLPKKLKGLNIPFTAFIDSDNYMWIITSDDNVGVYRGIINRLGFKK